MSFCLDTSAIVPLFVEEEKSAVMVEWITGVSEKILVSDLAQAEFCAAVSKLVRMALMTETKANDLISGFMRETLAQTEGVETHSIDVKMAARLVSRPWPKLLAADAIHIAICHRVGATLVSLDAGQVQAAGFANVKCVVPS